MYQSIPNVPGVYLITNKVTGKVYVGSARKMRSRVQCHRNLLRAGKHGNALLQLAWNKYGETAFTAEHICICSTFEHIRIVEQFEINARRSAERAHGYNINPVAAPGRAMPHLDETKRKIGAANKGKGGSRMRGVPRPAHVIEITAARYRGVGLPRATCDAAWAANRGNSYHLGHRHSANALARMSEKTRGERHPKAVLTAADVRDVRRMRAEGESGTAIARRFGLNSSTIYAVLNGKTWRHLEETKETA